MGLGTSVKLLGAGVIWRNADWRRVGDRLAQSLSGDEQERTLAGIGLVQAGERSVAPIESEFDEHGATKLMVRVLADIGGAEAHRVLIRISDGAGEVADLARDLAEGGPRSE